MVRFRTGTGKPGPMVPQPPEPHNMPLFRGGRPDDTLSGAAQAWLAPETSSARSRGASIWPWWGRRSQKPTWSTRTLSKPPPQWRLGTGSCWETRQQCDCSLVVRMVLVRCQPDGRSRRIGSLAAALTQCPAEMGRLPMTEKQHAECTIESLTSVNGAAPDGAAPDGQLAAHLLVFG
jgi:hypothetical protein